MTRHLFPQRLRLGTATALGLLTLAANAAQAQTVPAFDLAAPSAEASLPARASTTPGLAPLLASPAALRFAGEAARRTFPVFVTGEQSTQAGARLSLGYTTAVSVAPEGSSLVVSVNGVEVASQALKVGSPQALDIPVPPGLLRPGFNAVDMAVQQFHRVDCSIQGTYELWTALDPSRTGLTFGRTGAQMAGLSDLPILPRDADGKVHVAGLVPGGSPSARVDRTLVAIEAAVLIGAFEDPLVRLGDEAATDQAGLEVAVGTFDELGSLARQPASETPWAGVSFVPAKGGRPATLIASGATAGDVDRAVADLAAGARGWTHDGSQAGLQALADRRGRAIAAHGSVNLQELGADTRPFAGRLFREDLRLSLPADFYAADYDSASLVLNGAYAAKLSSEATLFVRANDQVVATLPLSSPHSGQIEEKRLKVPLDRLKPGANTIRIEATLPDATDQACEVTAAGPRQARFVLSGTTRLEMPALARVGAYPNLSATLAGVGVVGARDRELMVYVPGGDPAARDVAATLVARMAAGSGAIRRTRLVSALPSAESGDLLAVGTYSVLPDDLASLMRGRDEGSAFALKEKGSSLTSVSQAKASTIETKPLVGGATAMGDLTLPAFAEPVGVEKRIGEITRPVTAAFESAMARLGSSAGATPLELPEDGALLVQAAAPVDGAAWTLFAAPTSALLTQGIQRLGTAETWEAVAGARTEIPASAEDAVVTLDEGGERLFETQPRSLSNARLVLAGWFSRHSEQYAGLVLASSILLALSTFLLLRRLGEKSR